MGTVISVKTGTDECLCIYFQGSVRIRLEEYLVIAVRKTVKNSS